MPYREFKERAEQCGVCNAESVQICRRCGTPVCKEHQGQSGSEGRIRWQENAPRGDRALRRVCCVCAEELQRRLAQVTREYEQAMAARLTTHGELDRASGQGQLEFLQEFLAEHAHWNRLRRLLRCFERERPRHLARQREFRRRRVTEGICIACGEPATRRCHRCGTGLCEVHGVDQTIRRCRRCERDFRQTAGPEQDWLMHPLRAILYVRRRRRFLDQHPWDTGVYEG